MPFPNKKLLFFVAGFPGLTDKRRVGVRAWPFREAFFFLKQESQCLDKEGVNGLNTV